MRASLFTAALAAAAISGCRSTPPEGVALVGATLIDGSGRAPTRDAVVVVRGGKIVAAGPRADIEIPPKLRQVDLAGRWIIPGLIDAHAHVARWSLPRYLAWGVTTVRDVHGTLDSVIKLRHELSIGSIAGPRMFIAGAMIDGVPATYPDAIAAATPAIARKGIDRLVSLGVDYAKVYTRVDPAMLRATLDEAKTFRLKVTGHLGLTDAVTAAELGLSADEHMSGVPEATDTGLARALSAEHRRGFFPGWTAFERSWAGLDSAALARVARALARYRVVVVPTLVLHETFSLLDDPMTLGDTMLAVVPSAQRDSWNVAGMVQRAGWGPDEFAAFRRARPKQDQFLRLFRAAGGMIAAGTDAANQLLIPGYSEHEEMALLTAAGLTPAEALAAATSNGARLLGADSLGRIRAGAVADLVVLRRDPLKDIHNTRSIESVMSRGRLMQADSIRASW
ncbi:MAG: amidohydrolase family protein [Gemmatimonadales bacterium]|nr:amidohydrolase family protein [Gemmatimonadales bacterium]